MRGDSLLKKKSVSSIVRKWIFHSIFTGFYIAGLVVLTVEASTQGHESGAKSDAVGGQIEDIINDLNSDTALEYLPESAEFTNKKMATIYGSVLHSVPLVCAKLHLN